MSETRHSYESLLAQIMAEVGDNDRAAYSHQLCDSLLDNAFLLENEMFSPAIDFTEVRRKAISVAVNALRMAREMHGADEREHTRAAFL